MENRTSKKLFAGVLALSAGFILAACDPITTVPTSYNDAIVMHENEQGEKVAVDFEDNIMGKIYDEIATDKNSKIVSDLLELVTEKKFGSYYRIVEAANDSGKLSKYLDDFGATFKADDDIEGEAENRFKIFYEDIQSRISEFFYNEITSGSYNDDEGRFDEEKMALAHYYDLYDIQERDKAEGHTEFITSEVTKENAMEHLKARYDVVEERIAYEAGDKAKPFELRGYIEENVFPSIIKDKLVEEYVYKENYNSLGRSYARKVNYIKVSYEDHVIPWKMLKLFGDEYVESEKELNFEIIAEAIKGFSTIGNFKETTGDGVKAISTEAYNLLVETLVDPEDSSVVYTTDSRGDQVSEYVVKLNTPFKMDTVELVPAGTYFKNTKLGELIVSYKKALVAVEQGRFPTPSNNDELSKFVSSGKSHEYGLREKLISLAKEDYTTDGWFVKTDGLSELPSALRDRLFNINVATHLDDGSYIKETSENLAQGVYEYEIDAEGNIVKDDKGNAVKAKRLPYMRNIYGKMMVIPANPQAFEQNKYSYIYQDVEAKAFYMVQVLEAPSTPKLNPTQESSYAKIDEEHPFRTEEIARQVAKVLGTKDSYIKDAYTQYLKDNFKDFKFYETSFYEHFKSEYPELFEDEE